MTRLHRPLIHAVLALLSVGCGAVYARSVVPQPPTVRALAGCYVREAGRPTALPPAVPDTLALTAEPDITSANKPAWRVHPGPSREQAGAATWSWRPNARHPDSVSVWNNGPAGATLDAVIAAGRLTGVVYTSPTAVASGEAYAAARQQCLGFRR